MKWGKTALKTTICFKYYFFVIMIEYMAQSEE